MTNEVNMKKPTRYAADHNGHMVPTKAGPYVWASDADTLLAERDAEIARLRGEYSRACEAVMLAWGGIMPENSAWVGDIHAAAEHARAEGCNLHAQLTAHHEAVRKTIDQLEYMAEYMREHGPFYNNADGEVASRMEELRAAFGGNT